MNALPTKMKDRRRPFRVLRRLADGLIADDAYCTARPQGRAIGAMKIARRWYGLDQMELPLGPLTKRDVLAVCNDLVTAANKAVAYQARVPGAVLQHLVHCQTDAYRARFEAGRAKGVDEPDELKVALTRYQRAAMELQRCLDGKAPTPSRFPEDRPD